MAKNNDKPGSAPAKGRKLDVSTLESWLWEACIIRGPLDAPKFKDYILPLIFVKRLSDVFDDEIAHLAKDFGDEAKALKLVEHDRSRTGAILHPEEGSMADHR
jgi:type I restriction-modification system DNA methylase subunit